MRDTFGSPGAQAMEKLALGMDGLPRPPVPTVAAYKPVPNYAPTTPEQIGKTQESLIGQGLARGRMPLGDLRANAYRNAPGGIERVRQTALRYGNAGATPANTYSDRPIGQVPKFRSSAGGVVADGLYEWGTGRMTLSAGLSPSRRAKVVAHEGQHALERGLPEQPMKKWVYPEWSPQPGAKPATIPKTPPTPALPNARAATRAAAQAADPHKFIRSYYQGSPSEARAEFWVAAKRRMAEQGDVVHTPAEVPGLLKRFNQQNPKFFGGQQDLWNTLQNPKTAPRGADPATQYLQSVRAQGAGANVKTAAQSNLMGDRRSAILQMTKEKRAAMANVSTPVVAPPTPSQGLANAPKQNQLPTIAPVTTPLMAKGQRAAPKPALGTPIAPATSK